MIPHVNLQASYNLDVVIKTFIFTCIVHNAISMLTRLVGHPQPQVYSPVTLIHPNPIHGYPKSPKSHKWAPVAIYEFRCSPTTISSVPSPQGRPINFEKNPSTFVVCRAITRQSCLDKMIPSYIILEFIFSPKTICSGHHPGEGPYQV